MKSSRTIPIPFLILMLAGFVSLFGIFADRGSRASVVTGDSVQIQTVEQERMAAIYFRILSWLSNVGTPRAAQPVNGQHPASPGPHEISAPRPPARPGRIEFCALRLERDIVCTKRHHDFD